MSALDAEAYKISRQSIDRKSIHSTPPKHNFSHILHVGYCKIPLLIIESLKIQKMIDLEIYWNQIFMENQ